MSEYVQVLIVLFFYKSLIIVAGLVIIYLGYCFLTYESDKNKEKMDGVNLGQRIIVGAIFVIVSLIIVLKLDSIDIEKTREIVSRKSGFTKEVELIFEKVINQEQVNEKERQVLSEILKKKNLEQEDTYYHECNNYNN